MVAKFQHGRRSGICPGPIFKKIHLLSKKMLGPIERFFMSLTAI